MNMEGEISINVGLTWIDFTSGYPGKIIKKNKKKSG